MERTEIIHRIAHRVQDPANQLLTYRKGGRAAETNYRISVTQPLGALQRHREHAMTAEPNHLTRISSAGGIDQLAAVSDAAQRTGTFHALPSRIDDFSSPLPRVLAAKMAV
jgi:hypothetical protein